VSRVRAGGRDEEEEGNEEDKAMMGWNGVMEGKNGEERTRERKNKEDREKSK
jgi:hypothetical protein